MRETISLILIVGQGAVGRVFVDDNLGQSIGDDIVSKSTNKS